MPKPTVLVVRDPDFDNEYVVEGGRVRIVDVDLGVADLTNPEELQDHVESWRSAVAHLPARGPIRRRVEQIIRDLEAAVR